jgi:hypothetical protein
LLVPECVAVLQKSSADADVARPKASNTASPMQRFFFIIYSYKKPLFKNESFFLKKFFFQKKGVVRNTTAANLYENSPAFRGAR